MRPMRKSLLIGTVCFAFGAGAMAYADQQVKAAKAEPYRMIELFGDVLVTVKQRYVVPVDDKKLIQAAIQGMLSSLDPHSNYLDPQALSEVRDENRGQYGGLGLEVTSEEGAVKVITPMDGGPAGALGVQSGDYITAIDGKSVVGLPLNDAVKQMRGPVGTSVTLTLVRDKQNPFNLKVTRALIQTRAVTSKLVGDYGYLRVSTFLDEKTGDETVAALKDFKLKNPHLKGVVLDLRNNGGGIVDQAVEVAGAFLDGGEVVSQRGRDPKDVQRLFAKPGGDLVRGLPVVVLINNGSASASEIVAGALKDRHRATVVGLTSFGKGSVQSEIPLAGGEDGALLLTTARYFTPSGGSIQKTGIAPDLAVARSKAQAELVYDDAAQYSEASFKNALDSQEGRARETPKAIEIPVEAAEAKDKDEKPQIVSAYKLTEADLAKDFQFQRALDVLKYGSVEAAQKVHPLPHYTPPKPAFAKLDKGGAAKDAAPAANSAKPAEKPQR